MQVLRTTCVLLRQFRSASWSFHLRTVCPNFDVLCTEYFFFALARLANFQNVRALGQEHSTRLVFARAVEAWRSKNNPSMRDSPWQSRSQVVITQRLLQRTGGGSTLNERSVILTSLGYPPYGVQQAKFQINYRPGTTQGMIWVTWLNGRRSFRLYTVVRTNYSYAWRTWRIFCCFFLFFKQPRWVLLVTGLAYFF